MFAKFYYLSSENKRCLSKAIDYLAQIVYNYTFNVAAKAYEVNVF